MRFWPHGYLQNQLDDKTPVYVFFTLFPISLAHANVIVEVYFVAYHYKISAGQELALILGAVGCGCLFLPPLIGDHLPPTSCISIA